MRRTHIGVLVVAAVASSVLWGYPVAMVSASLHSARSGGVHVSSSYWGAVAAVRDSPPATEALVLTWSVFRGDSYQIFDVVNIGSIDLAGQLLVVTNSSVHGGGTRAPVVALAACNGGVWLTYTSCTGTVVPLGDSSSQSLTMAIALRAGGRISVRASTVPASSAFTSTIDVIINRGQVRPGGSTTS